MRPLRHFFSGFTILGICLLAATAAMALSPGEIEKAKQSVVKVVGEGDCHGTGIVIDTYRILTAGHVVEKCATAVIFQDGTERKVVEKITNNVDDLGIMFVSVPEGVPALPLAKQYLVGEPVTLLGYPESLPLTANTGTILSDEPTGVPGTTSERLTDALVAEGMSGGPVVNDNGELVGVITGGIMTGPMFPVKTGFNLFVPITNVPLPQYADVFP